MQSVFNNPAAGAGVTGYYGSYNHYNTDFYGAASHHLNITPHQTASQHQHAPYSGFPDASYGMLTALHSGGASGAPWYDHGGVDPLDAAAGFCRFDISTGSSTAFRRLPVGVKQEAVMRTAESETGRSAGRSACRELKNDVEVS